MNTLRLLFVLLVASVIATACGFIASADQRVQPTIKPTPMPQELDPGGRFSWLTLVGKCKSAVETWKSLPGVWVRYSYDDVEYAGETAYVVYNAYPVVILKDSNESGQTWAVDFGYDPVRVYAQDTYFWGGVEMRRQFQPLDPEPYLKRGLEIVPNHTPIVVRSEWRWTDYNDHYEWAPISTSCD
jgi:hypothetical protein